MPSVCSTPGVNERPASEVIPFPGGAGTTLVAAVTAIAGDTLGGPGFSTILGPTFFNTPTDWTKISNVVDARVAKGGSGGADDGMFFAIFSRQEGAATDVLFDTVLSGVDFWWSAIVCRLSGGNAMSHIPVVVSPAQVLNPAPQGAGGRTVVTPGITTPVDDCLLMYFGASPDYDDGVEIDVPPTPGMSFGAVAKDGNLTGSFVPISNVAMFFEALGVAGPTGPRTRIYENTDGPAIAVGAMAYMMAFR